jgi:hypothetical protein
MYYMPYTLTKFPIGKQIKSLGSFRGPIHSLAKTIICIPVGELDEREKKDYSMINLSIAITSTRDYGNANWYVYIYAGR